MAKVPPSHILTECPLIGKDEARIRLANDSIFFVQVPAVSAEKGTRASDRTKSWVTGITKGPAEVKIEPSPFGGFVSVRLFFERNYLCPDWMKCKVL